MSAVVQAHSVLAKVLGDDAPLTCAIERSTQSPSTEAQAWTALREAVAAGQTGWCATTDSVWRVDTGTDFEAIADGMHLLDAQVGDISTSTHISHLGSHWQITTISELEGDTHWVQAIKRRGIDPDQQHVRDGRTVVYRAYWPVDLDVLVPFNPGDGALPPDWAPPQIQPAAVRFVALKPAPDLKKGA